MQKQAFGPTNKITVDLFRRLIPDNSFRFWRKQLPMVPQEGLGLDPRLDMLRFYFKKTFLKR